MPVPRSIAAMLRHVGTAPLPGEAALESYCEGAKYHSPNPLRLHQVDLGLGREVLLCGTCRDNAAVLHVLIHLDDAPTELPWRREFGNKLRALFKEPDRA